jgi:hypothetical protein
MPAVENWLDPCRKPKSTISGWALTKVSIQLSIDNLQWEEDLLYV